MVSLIGSIGLSLFGLVFLLLGLGVIKFGRMFSSPNRTVEGAAVRDVAALTPGGVAAVQGTARPGDAGTVEGPMRGTEALATRTVVKEDTGAGDTQGWRTVDERSRQVPFVLDDGTGELLVDPGGSAPAAEMDWTDVPGGADPPEAVRQYVENTAVEEAETTDPSAAETGASRRYGEGAVVPGDQVHAYGRVERRESDGGPDLALTDANDGPFVYGNKPLEEVGSGNRVVAVFAYVLGGGFALFGLLFVVLPWAPA